MGKIFRRKRETSSIEASAYPENNILGDKKEVYSVSKLYVNCPTCESEECCPLEVELRICLEFSDWCKFQDQEFYQELIQYLDKLKTQKQNTQLDAQQNSGGNKASE